jgi:hypothetical protein
MGQRNSAYRVLVVKPEGKGPLGRPECTWDDNIKIGFPELELGRGELL